MTTDENANELIKSLETAKYLTFFLIFRERPCFQSLVMSQKIVLSMCVERKGMLTEGPLAKTTYYMSRYVRAWKPMFDLIDFLHRLCSLFFVNSLNGQITA